MNKRKTKTWREAARLNARALKLLFKRYPQMILSRFISVIWTSLTPYAGIYLSALIIEELVGNRSAERLKELVLITLIAAAAISLITALLNKWKNTHGIGTYYKVDNIISQKLMDMDYADSDDIKTLDLMNEIYQTQNGGGWGLYRMIGNYEDLFSSCCTVFGGVSLTVSLFLNKVPDGAGALTLLNEPIITLFVILIMFAATFAAPLIENKAVDYVASTSGEHNLGNRLFGYFGWLGYEKELATDVRIYAQSRFCEKYNKDKAGTWGSNGRFAKLSMGVIGFYNAAAAAVSVVFTGLAYIFTCLKALGGAFGLGMVTQYVASITKVSSGAAELMVTLGVMRNNAVFLERVFEFLDIPNDMYQGSLTVEKRRDRKYQIEFKGVSFKYPGSDNYALMGVNMKLEIGRRIAIVGMNGSGKTTFIKLLCRLYDPTEGEILLNGIDIRKYNYKEYMDIFSVVFQDFKLLAFKLGENVASGVDYDGAAAEDCLIKAGFGDRLKSLNSGTETYLYKGYDKDGVDVSGGEAQKIAIARALYKDAPFIVLDEPTAALDPVAEAEIYEKFNEIAGDRTAIYISHRLSSCKFCDEIAVFHGGTVVQRGSHSELLADKEGKYCELWNAQAQYYVEKEE